MHEEVMWMDFIISPDVIPHFVSYAILASVILIGLAFSVSRKMELVPGKVQNILEILSEAMLNLAEETIGGHYGRTFFPLIATIFLYVMTCNFMGLIPGFTSPKHAGGMGGVSADLGSVQGGAAFIVAALTVVRIGIATAEGQEGDYQGEWIGELSHIHLLIMVIFQFIPMALIVPGP